MITIQEAHDFSERWISAWNEHDLKAILSLYADELDYYSAKIAILGINKNGRLNTKAAVGAYFERGLEVYPDLHFKLQQVFYGVNSVVIHYLSMNDIPAAEVFELNEAGKIVRVYCNYAS